MPTVTPSFSIPKMQWSLLLDETCEKINNLGNCVVSKLTSLSTQQPMLQNALKVMEENKETIYKTLALVGISYYATKSKLPFLASLITGFVGSSSLTSVALTSLAPGPLVDRNDTPSLAKYFFGSVLVNSCIGKSPLDNTLFAAIAGLTIGNTLYHIKKADSDTLITKLKESTLKIFSDLQLFYQKIKAQ